MLDVKQQKVARENMAQKDSAFTEVSGLEVRVRPGKPHGRERLLSYSLQPAQDSNILSASDSGARDP